ncbi:hypothetical protein OC834_002089 [Tilletia horrida]|uniref:Uncharacterized protein n=1 Tax=Tilletia horrida TaxID=155126 RepID=A0AAN6GGJ4_9BASI|nr:hypothetical protein OC835_004662 [Tilletia horrida]KAK0533833.1 hypothetical protein OC834_002089 [Tilletia horrida]KAK0536149.1 hypothetical protein OC842_002097 [Tilletia horrida]KAK0558577.1 hypothetical protein OC844_005049 [Tilletia horrida]
MSTNPTFFDASSIGAQAADEAFTTYQETPNKDADRLNHAEAKAQLLKKVHLLVASAIDRFQDQNDDIVEPSAREEAKRVAEEAVVTLLDTEGVRDLQTS